MRYGLELVRREVEREFLAPLPEVELTKAYKQLGAEEVKEDAKMGRACARPRPGELD